MARCGARDEDDPARLPCTLRGEHGDHVAADGHSWPNPELLRTIDRPVSGETLRRATKVAYEGARSTRRAQAQLGAANSRAANEAVEPSRGTRQQQVLDYLRERPGAWVDGLDLRTAEVGGSSGDRRARELKAMGWPIEAQPTPGSGVGAWQYRLRVED